VEKNKPLLLTELHVDVLKEKITQIQQIALEPAKFNGSEINVIQHARLPNMQKTVHVNPVPMTKD